MLEKLGKQFGIDTKVIDHLLNVVKVESLDDIAAMEPQDLRECIKDIKDINVMLQTSRLKQAWTGIKKAGTVADEAKRKGEAGEDLVATGCLGEWGGEVLGFVPYEVARFC